MSGEKMPAFPKTIFVKYEVPSNDDPYLVASREVYGLVDPGNKTEIATYQLVETTVAEMVVSTAKPIKAKR
jgi:hypothetical protein